MGKHGTWMVAVMAAACSANPPSGTFDAASDAPPDAPSDAALPRCAWEATEATRWIAGQGIMAAAGDLDGDGDADLVFALHAQDSVQLIWNAGGGVFVPGATYLVGSGPERVQAAENDYGHEMDVGVGDLDGDGAVDVLGASVYHMDHDSDDGCCRHFMVSAALHNDGTGALTRTSPAVVDGQSGWSFDVVDFDGDGSVDVVASRRDVSVFANDGAGSFARVIGPVDTTGAGVDVADYDGDGRNDLVTVGHVVDLGDASRSRSVVKVHWGGGAGGSFVDVYSTMERNVHPRPELGIDFDGDGERDLLFRMSSGMHLLRNTGARSFEAPVRRPELDDLHGLHAADLDGDGDQDVVASATAGAVVVLRNDGGHFTRAQLDIGAAAADVLALHDVDGNGTVDIVLGVNGAVWVLLDTGGGFCPA